MGFTGQESHIPLGFFFRSMYCGNCGEKLKKQRLVQTVRKGDIGYDSYVGRRRQIGMDAKMKVSYVYRCPRCGKQTSYEDQLRIDKKQKQLNRKNLSE